jgi:hypothetical protein
VSSWRVGKNPAKHPRAAHAPAPKSQPPAPPHPPLSATGEAPRGWVPTPRRAATVVDPGITARETVRGVSIQPNGVSAAAMTEARHIAGMIGTRPDLAEQLQRQKVTLVLIPSDTRMTDLPEFSSLRGKKTFDGRPWEDVRGSGGLRLNDGRLVVGISEENLAGLPSDPYQGRYSVGLHELAHALHLHGVSRDDSRDIHRAFAARKTAGGPWTDAYASSDEKEYFAQGVCAWFDRNDGVGHDGADWVRANDPTLAAILTRLFPAPAPAPT